MIGMTGNDRAGDELGAHMAGRRRSLSPHGLFFLAFCSLGAPTLIVGSGCSSEAQAGQPNAPDRDATEADVKSKTGGALGLVEAYNPNESLAPMLSRVQPAVVAIRASSRGGMFGGGSGGIGSGFVIRADGYVVTNHHVIAGQDSIEVHFEDGRRFRAEVVGSDAQTDLAVLKLEDANDLTTVSLGSSDDLDVGDWVVAVGTPMGLEQTVTRGIISAKGRGSLGLYQDGYADFLQTDAAINPGNSGGPLFNLAGEVIGINTAVGGHDGLGFAIPVDQAKIVIPRLIADGKVSRGWLGVGGRDQLPEFGQRPVPGAVIGEVHANTPAAAAGLQPGDRVVAIDGEVVEDFDHMRGRIGEYGPNDRVTLEVVRDGRTVDIPVDLGERPDPNALARYNGFGGGIGPKQPTPQPAPKSSRGDLYDGNPAKLGIEVRETTDGLEVARVVDGSVAARLGLKAGDILTHVNGERVEAIADIGKALESDRSRAATTVRRGNGTHSAMISAGH